MAQTKKDFLLTVNFLLFKIHESPTENRKQLPEKKLMVLLEQRERPPFSGHWQCPYGFVTRDESLDQGVYRILKEKTEVENLYFEQLYTWGATDRDPSARVIATSYYALLPQEKKANQKIKETKNLKWFEVHKKRIGCKKLSDTHLICTDEITLINKESHLEISYTVTEDTFVEAFEKRSKYTYEPHEKTPIQMAYDHIKILDYALDRIKNKVHYTNIAFGLLPSKFTITELQQVYEILLGKTLIKSNFRQLISKKIEKTDETKKAGAYRPSALYRLKKSAIIED